MSVERPASPPPVPVHPGFEYRPDIDGLRAVAIVSVVLLHLGFPGFGGGFVGVDIFFVLSGYLITAIVYRDIRLGTFSFGGFYERRVRRLFPALFVVLLATTVAAAVLFLPADLAAYGESLVATTLFGANFFFMLPGRSADPLVVPLGPTWSLALEEQFYFIFPWLLAALALRSPKQLRWIIGGITLLSLVACLIVVERAPTLAKLAIPFRAWELLIGSLIALGAAPRLPWRAVREALAVGAMWMIGYAVLGGARDPATYPGIQALLPTLGAGILIVVGSSGGSVVNRVLGLKPIVFLGLISYSLYLWHWPVVVFMSYDRMRLTALDPLVMLALSVVLATLSWRWVERPFRTGIKGRSHARVFAGALACMTVLVAAGLIAKTTGGLPGRVPDEVRRIAGMWDERPTSPCYDAAPVGTRDPVCAIGAPGAPTFLLWGDLQSLALMPAVDSLARARGIAGLYAGRTGCPPLLGVQRYDSPASRCDAFSEDVVGALDRHPGVRRVLLVGRWALYSTGTRFGREQGPVARISPLGPSGNPEALEAGLDRTLDRMGADGVRVIVVAEPPEVGWSVPTGMARLRFLGLDDPAGPTLEEYENRQRASSAVFTRIARAHDFDLVELSDLFCPDGACLVSRGDLPLYRDAQMLSPPGAAMVAARLGAALIGPDGHGRPAASRALR